MSWRREDDAFEPGAQNREGRRVAVIVNDMSEVNIDADLVRADTELSRTDETLAEISNECICWPIRSNLPTW